MLFSAESTPHAGTPGEMKRAPWLSTAKHATLSHTSLAEVNVGRAWVWVCVCVSVCVCGTRVSVCEYIKSVRYQQSTIHQMNKNNRSNPAVILLLRLRCHDVIGNYSSATTKCFFGYRSNQRERRNADGELINFQVLTIKKKTHTYSWPKYLNNTDTAILLQ